jgi:hypothetical protein
MEYYLKMIRPFSITGIGSLPHLNPDEACTLVLETFDIPFWPQLPNVSFREFMIPQYAEGLPCLRTNEKKEAIWIERDDNELAGFYEKYREGMKLSISDSYAKGLHTFIRFLSGRHFNYLKGQVTGPLTFTLGLKDTHGRLIYFDEEFREVSLLVLKAKVRWQIDILKSYADHVILFIDEPVLSALGSSAYLGVSPEESLRLLREICNTVHESGGISGIHCCSKADWPLVINSGVKIISFDAYDYIESISLYPGEFLEFLHNGGYLAWGIVPTTSSINTENPDSLKQRFDAGIQMLSRHIPVELLLSRILLTPSCGAGSLTVHETEAVFRILIELKQRVSETP